jgi:hypothetical protein
MKTLRPVAEEARMSRPDEGMIHQWLDGECTPEESAEIERLIATDAAWAAAVAEARGLIAASSRIVGALDAVPRAMPAGSRAAPRVRANQLRAIPAWMKVAAAAVIVAGSAYALREKAAEPFRPAATSVDVATEQQQLPLAPGVQITRDPRELRAPTDVPTMAPEPTANRTVPPASPVPLSQPAPATPVELPPPVSATRGDVAAAAGAGAAEKISVPPPAPPRSALEIGRAEDAVSTRRARMAADAPRGAIARAQEMAPTAAPAPGRTLEGCWRVSAPPELLGVLSAPEIRRQAGDTLVLVTARGDVTVVRAGDELRGGLQAKLEACGATF